MKMQFTLTHFLPALAVAALAAGCTPASSPSGSSPDEHAAHGENGAHGDHGGHGEDAAGHEHPTTGPHGGHFVDLGDHEFLAELVHDSASATIYLYEHDGTTPVPTDAKEVTINLLHDGQPEQFQLAASPVADDPAGQSSRFMIENADLAGHLDEESAEPKLNARINGMAYSASLAHHHDHAGHDHSGHDHGHEGHDHEVHDHEGHEHEH